MNMPDFANKLLSDTAKAQSASKPNVCPACGTESRVRVGLGYFCLGCLRSFLPPTWEGK